MLNDKDLVDMFCHVIGIPIIKSLNIPFEYKDIIIVDGYCLNIKVIFYDSFKNKVEIEINNKSALFEHGRFESYENGFVNDFKIVLLNDFLRK